MKRTIKRLKSLLFVPKDEKVSDKSFSQIIASSILGILICGICLAGLTWAWFTSSVISTSSNITAAEFTVETAFKMDNATLNPPFVDGKYVLDSGTYTVTVTAGGTASTGYCKVEFNGLEYYTVQLFKTPGENKPRSITFTLYANQGDRLVITPQWGIFSGSTNKPLIGNKSGNINSIGTPPAEPATVEESTEETTKTEALLPF